ncbi:MAG: LysM peptidoglycan-binding domain-containing protein, partial [Bacteroidota bacterium]
MKKLIPHQLLLKLSVFLISFILASAVRVNSQDTSVQVEKSSERVLIGGNIYFLHVVKRGQTLYSISRAYGMVEKDIATHNPGVIDGLKEGQV